MAYMLATASSIQSEADQKAFVEFYADCFASATSALGRTGAVDWSGLKSLFWAVVAELKKQISWNEILQVLGPIFAYILHNSSATVATVVAFVMDLIAKLNPAPPVNMP